MFEIKILCPPINLYSKPWQHAFDKRYVMDTNKHPAMKIYWERCGKPQLMFKLGDDPWVEVAGEPSWNPAFEYRVKGTTLQVERDANPVAPNNEAFLNSLKKLDRANTNALKKIEQVRSTIPNLTKSDEMQEWLQITPGEVLAEHDYDRGFNQGYDNGFKQGYNKALEDIKTHLHEKQNRK